MDFAFSPEDARFLAEFKRFCDAEVRPRAKEVDAAGAIPADLWQSVEQSGYLQLFYPKELGGAGRSAALTSRAMATLAGACASTYWSVSFSAGICGRVICALGTEEQKRRFAGPLMRGERVGCFPVVERGSPSDPSQVRASLEREGSDYLLSGEKHLVIHAPNADLAATLVHAPAGEGGGLRFAFVDLRQAGVSRSQLPLLGLRGVPFGALKFNRVRIPASDVVTIDYPKFVMALEWGQLVIVAGAVGLGEALLDCARDFALGRQSFGGPILRMPAVQGSLASMRAELEATELMMLRAAAVKDTGVPAGELMQAAKIFGSEMSARMAQSALNILGAWGLTPGFELERLYRDAITQGRGGMANDRIRELIAAQRLKVDVNTYALPHAFAEAQVSRASKRVDRQIDAEARAVQPATSRPEGGDFRLDNEELDVLLSQVSAELAPSVESTRPALGEDEDAPTTEHEVRPDLSRR